MDGAQMNMPTCDAAAHEQGKKGIAGSTIKIIAVIAMLIDHVAAGLLVRYMMVKGMSIPLYVVYDVMRLIGRLGFPIFCFLLVEGFQKTRNIGKYAARLGLFALISEIPFDLAFSGRMLEFNYQNVYFTLFFGILALWAIDFILKKDFGKVLQVLLTVLGIVMPVLYVPLAIRSRFDDYVDYVLFLNLDRMGKTAYLALCLVVGGAMLVFWAVYRAKKGSDRAWRMCACVAVTFAAMFAADFLKTDYSGMGVLTIVMMYLFRRNKVISMLSGCIVLVAMSLAEFTAFFTLIPVARYNGERGLKMKYFFYAFYPVHLLLIWLIAWVMGTAWIPVV